MILFLIDNLAGGGAQKQLYLLSKELHMRGVDLLIITYHQYADDRYSMELRQYGVPMITLNCPHYWSRFIQVRRAIKKLNPSLVVSLLNGANILNCLVKASLYQPLPIIVSDRTGLTKAISLRERIRYRLYQRYANLVLTNSTHTAKKIKERAPWLSKKIEVIWNMALNPNLSKVQTDDKPDFVILIGASYREIKNPINWIKGLALCIDKYNLPIELISMYWHGDKQLPENYVFMDRLYAMVSNLNLEGQIHLEGYSPNLTENIKAADFCALPSIYEGCSNFIVESMFCSKPVICSDVCSNPDLIDEGKGGFLFDPTDIESICEAIYKAYNTSLARRRSMGKYNHQKAMRLFNLQEKVSQYLECFSSLTNQTKGTK